MNFNSSSARQLPSPRDSGNHLRMNEDGLDPYWCSNPLLQKLQTHQIETGASWPWQWAGPANATLSLAGPSSLGGASDLDKTAPSASPVLSLFPAKVANCPTALTNACPSNFPGVSLNVGTPQPSPTSLPFRPFGLIAALQQQQQQQQSPPQLQPQSQSLLQLPSSLSRPTFDLISLNMPPGAGAAAGGSLSALGVLPGLPPVPLQYDNIGRHQSRNSESLEIKLEKGDSSGASVGPQPGPVFGQHDEISPGPCPFISPLEPLLPRDSTGLSSAPGLPSRAQRSCSNAGSERKVSSPLGSRADTLTSGGVEKSTVSHSLLEKQRRNRINSMIEELGELVHSPGGDRKAARPKHIILDDTISLVKQILKASSTGGVNSQHGSDSRRPRARVQTPPERGDNAPCGRSLGAAAMTTGTSAELMGTEDMGFFQLCNSASKIHVVVNHRGDPAGARVQVKCSNQQLSQVINALRTVPCEVLDNTQRDHDVGADLEAAGGAEQADVMNDG